MGDPHLRFDESGVGEIVWQLLALGESLGTYLRDPTPDRPASDAGTLVEARTIARRIVEVAEALSRHEREAPLGERIYKLRPFALGSEEKATSGDANLARIVAAVDVLVAELDVYVGVAMTSEECPSRPDALAQTARRLVALAEKLEAEVDAAISDVPAVDVSGQAARWSAGYAMPDTAPNDRTYTPLGVAVAGDTTYVGWASFGPNVAGIMRRAGNAWDDTFDLRTTDAATGGDGSTSLVVRDLSAVGDGWLVALLSRSLNPTDTVWRARWNIANETWDVDWSRELTAADYDLSRTWEPTGIGVLADGTEYYRTSATVERYGGAERLFDDVIGDLSPFVGFSISLGVMPDGRYVAFPIGADLHLLHTVTGNVTRRYVTMPGDLAVFSSLTPISVAFGSEPGGLVSKTLHLVGQRRSPVIGEFGKWHVWTRDRATP